MKGRKILVVTAMAAVLAAGCAGDMVQQVLSKPEMATQAIQMIAGKSDLAGQMVDQLLGSDSTRTMLVDRLMANPEAAQLVTSVVSRNQGMVEGVINAAVQDPAMRDHVMALLKGMQMVAAKK
jgi:hypothetical protein